MKVVRLEQVKAPVKETEAVPEVAPVAAIVKVTD